MNASTAAFFAALVVQLALGFSVLQANRRRKANQSFLLLSLAAAAWLTSLFWIVNATSERSAELAIRAASAAGALIVVTLNLLRLSVRYSDERWPVLFRRSAQWLIAGAAIMGLCLTPFFLHGVRMGNATSVGPVPVYGPGIYIFAAYFCAAMLTLALATLRDLRQTSGAVRVELGFVLIGGIIALVLSLPLALLLGVFFEPAALSRLAPFRVILFSIVVAYGMATRKIMEVGVFLRRMVSFTLLTGYLLALYLLVWWLVLTANQIFFRSADHTAAHIIAALVITFAMAPARGVSQSIAERLFIGTRRLDFRATMRKATAILQSVGTLDNLLERFAQTIGEAVNTDRIFILLPTRRGYVQRHPAERSSALLMAESEPLIEFLEKNQEPIVLDELLRIGLTPELDRVRQRMQELEVAVAMGIFSREHLAGVMLLGPRLTGRIYGSVEQNALQVLCGQLAIAIDNALLFTEVQNAKIYNETLLQNLTTGVIAADADGLITVFNKEAEEITGLPSGKSVDRSIDELPAALRDVLRETLRTGEFQYDREVVLRSGDEGVIVRASSSIFHGQEGQMLGALMVLTDITALKRLEEQIRRSDRLASLGTLSAGMAHEIKNPLVSIKTFAQLLPERYNDSDFRDTFSNLIGHEIDRIDSLVNQLLRFARPAKPLLRPVHVHDVLEKSLTLVGHRLYQREIKLSRFWNAEVDTIRADPDQLEQVFLNFFLNAMEAMKQGGELTVLTEVRPAEEWPVGINPLKGKHGEPREVLRITVRDDGEGIRHEDIPHVFDPFFTTKDYGTGLGLSVVHGIVQEHGGEIEVESELSRGTAFFILLPLVRFREEVAAA